MTLLVEASPQTLRGLRLRYPDKQYSAMELGSHFAALDSAWQRCLELSFFMSHGHDFVEQQLKLVREERELRFHRERHRHSLPPDREQLAIHIEQRNKDSLDRNTSFAQLRDLQQLRRLTIATLTIASPMDLALSAAGLSGFGAGAYAVHLLANVLRNPESVGGWLPELQKAWHQQQAEKARARLERVEAETILSVRLLELRKEAMEIKPLPNQITISGIISPAEELDHLND